MLLKGGSKTIHTYNCLNIAKMAKCSPADFKRIEEFIVDWNIAVHGGKPK